jgi:coenzyme PQQ synthesis protein D (PqqD)
MDSSGDWAPSPHVTSRDTQGGAILLDLAGGHCWEVNHTGAKMWNLLVEHQSARKAIAKIPEVLQDAPDRATEDMATFVARLAQLGAVVAIPDPPRG